MRTAREKKSGGVFYICNYTGNKEDRFDELEYVELIQSIVQRTVDKFDIRILAESIHANTVQWVIDTAFEEDISEVMKYMKQLISQHYIRLTGRSGPLWDDRYKSRLLETSDGIEAAINFVHHSTDLQSVPDFDAEVLNQNQYEAAVRIGYKDSSNPSLDVDTLPEETSEITTNSLMIYHHIYKMNNLSFYQCKTYASSYIFIYERVNFRKLKWIQGVILQ